MREIIMDGILRHIQPLKGFEHAKLLEVSPGYARISMEVTSDALNLYGNIHGGFLFSLCDMTAGMATYAYEWSNVTQNGTIHFLKGMSEGTIFVEAKNVHKGKKTAVNHVTITSEEGTLLVMATFTMFLLKQIL